MKLAILSDTHDNIWTLKNALAYMASAEVAIHCGDLCSPFIVKQLGEGLAGKPVHVVWGNNEGDVLLMTRLAAQLGNITFHGTLAELELDGVKIAVNHYPDLAYGLARTGKYNLVCCGHSHVASLTQVGDCQLLNPGEIMGLLGRRSFAFFDTQSRAVEFVEVA